MAVDKPGGGGGGASSSSSSSSAASTVDRFLKIVLSWDYLRLVADSKVRSNNSPTNHSAITPETLNPFYSGLVAGLGSD
jgi:senataxin